MAVSPFTSSSYSAEGGGGGGSHPVECDNGKREKRGADTNTANSRNDKVYINGTYLKGGILFRA